MSAATKYLQTYSLFPPIGKPVIIRKSGRDSGSATHRVLSYWFTLAVIWKVDSESRVEMTDGWYGGDRTTSHAYNSHKNGFPTYSYKFDWYLGTLLISCRQLSPFLSRGKMSISVEEKRVDAESWSHTWASWPKVWRALRQTLSGWRQLTCRSLSSRLEAFDVIFVVFRG